MYSLIIFNFKVSVWVSIVGILALFSVFTTGYPDSLSHVGAYANRIVMWPVVFGTLNVIFWFGYYKSNEGHGLAFFIGWFALEPVIGALVSEAINNVQFSQREKFLLTYIGISHILYGLTEWREIFTILNSRE